jgi:serpin B
VKLVITNAIYFNGTWTMPFDEKRTSEQDFIVNAQKTVKAPMMSRDFFYNYTNTDELHILELPYLGGRLSMLILLPNEIDGIKSLEESLSAQKISKWNDELLEGRLFVQIPKFTMETDYDLIPELKKLGISAAFGPADFSGISNADLYISQAVHKAFVDVNEKGTEAAAATGIAMRESMPPSFTADHPFIFIIQDKETGNILFIGKVVDPTA